jgi:UrcA family protein
MAANVMGSWASTLMSIGAAALLASPIVVAQTQQAAPEGAHIPEVDVEAQGTVVERTPVERQGPTNAQERSGGEFEKVRLDRRINLADLDLATPEGVKDLHARIEASARAQCNEIRTLSHPLTTQASQYAHLNDNCVKDAVAGARKQADTMVAAAEGKKHRG